MTDNVVDLHVNTTLDIPAEKVLNYALRANLDEVAVLGYTTDGEFYFAASEAHGPDVLWLLEQARNELMKRAQEE